MRFAAIGSLENVRYDCIESLMELDVSVRSDEEERFEEGIGPCYIAHTW